MKKMGLLFISVVLIIFNSTVHGVVSHGSNSIVYDDCLLEGSCMAVCNYTNSFGWEKSNITIYYHFGIKQYSIKWNNPKKDKEYEKGPATYTVAFSSKNGKNVYFEPEVPPITKFSCPENGYVDVINKPGVAFDAVCFDNDGTSCAKKHNSGNVVRRFNLPGNRGYEDTKKTMDFADELNKQNDKIIDKIIKGIDEGEYSDAEARKEYDDFLADYSNGNASNLPTFIEESESYKNLGDLIDDKKLDELKEIDQLEQSGELTAEEASEKREEIDKKYNIVKDALNSSKMAVSDGYNYDDHKNYKHTCDSILGSPTDPSEPAFWIQKALDVMRYVAIAALIILTSLDFLKATAAEDQDQVKSAVTKAMKRFIYTAVLFALPILINALFVTIGFYDDPLTGESAKCTEIK